jgi:hypothetical protein
MTISLDFTLPSCPGIPESMWMAASSMIDAIIKRSWLYLGTFVTIQLIVHAFMDIAHGTLDIRAAIRTLSHAFLIACFFKYYKPLLIFFDGFIDQIGNIEEVGLDNWLEKEKGRLHAFLDKPSILGFFRNCINIILDFLPKIIFLFTHKGAICYMHYIKAVTLVIMSQLGPLAALFSLLPGPFKKGWSSWVSSYIHVTCWSITLKVFWLLSKAFANASSCLEPTLEPIPSDTFFSETIGYTILSYILLFSIFLTPAWTTKFMGQATAVNLGAAFGISPSSVAGSAGGIAKGMLKGMLKRLDREKAI